MHYLIYVSSAVKLLNNHELLSLLEQSRKNNLTYNITGMLLYIDGNFMQCLEGEKDDVAIIYDKICHDSRHSDLIQIVFEPLAKRNFANWSMGFKVCDENMLRTHSDLTNLSMETFKKEPFNNNKHVALQLLSAFYGLPEVN